MEAPKTFEESLARLEEIVKQLDGGRIDLDTALSRYEEGVGLLKRCHGMLESAQRKIEILRGVDDEGTPQIEAAAEKDFRTTG